MAVRSVFRQPATLAEHALRWLAVPWIGWGLVGGLAVVWAYRLWAIYREWGLFRRLGDDFGLYSAITAALWSGDPVNMYRRDVLHGYLQALAPFTSEPSVALPAELAPYPPLFAWLFTPFTLPPPPIGFALWTAVNLLPAAWLAWRVAQSAPGRAGWLMAALLLVSYPVVYQFQLGQPILFLAVAVGEFYLSLRAGRDVQAGLWLSLLLFRPQYGILLGPLLIWKRRWAAVGGAVAGGTVILGGSLVVAGVPTILAYPSALGMLGSFHGTEVNLPEFMINWRALIVWLMPGIADEQGLLLTLALGALTVLVAALAWRGPWAPQSPRFAERMVLVLLATLLASYHSHLYGAVLLAVPLASTWSGAWARGIVLAGILAPDILAGALGRPLGGTRLVLLACLALFAYLAVVLLRERRSATRER